MKTFLTLLLVCTYAHLQAQAPHLAIPIGHSGDITAAAISPDEKYILTGSADQTAILWDIAGREIQTFKGHSTEICAVAFLYNGTERFALTGDRNGHIIRWDLSGNKKQTIHRSPSFMHGANWVNQMFFSPDGETVCIEARNFNTCVDILSDVDVPSVEKSAAQTPPAGIPSEEQVVFGKKFVLSFGGKVATLWDVNGKKIQTFTGHSAAVVSVAFSPIDGGSSILTNNSNGLACMWDLTGGGVTPKFAGQTGPVSNLVFAPDGKALLATSGDVVKLLDITGKPIRTFDNNGPTAFSPDGKLLLAGFEKGIKGWDRNSGKELPFFLTENADAWGSPRLIAFSPATTDDPAGGKFMATGGSEIKIWNRGNPRDPLQTFALGGDGDFSFMTAVRGLAFAPDGKSVLAHIGEATVTQWDINSGSVINTFEGHHEGVTAMTVADAGGGGMYVLTGSNDNTAKLWDPANNVVKSYSSMPRQYGDPIGSDLVGGEIQTYKGHTNDVIAVAFSPAGPDGPKYVLTGSRDNTAKIWDRATGTEIATLINLGEADWVVASPSGLFDASPGAMKQMYYVIGAEVVDLDQLKERYYEPGLLAKLMGFSKGELRDVSTLGQVPLYPEINAAVKDDQLDIQLTPRSGGMGKLSFFINGKEVAEDLNPGGKTTLTVDLNAYDKYYLPGANTLALRAYNSANWLKSAAYEIDYDPPARGRGTGSGSVLTLGNAKPHLYAIVVGTSDYSGESLDLRFPDLDAAAMAQALDNAGKALFEDRVHLSLLTSDGKTPESISSKKNIAAVFSKYAAQAKPTDILVVYFSGHGLTYGSAEKSQFYYLTKDITSPDLKDDAVRNNYTVSSEDLTQWLTAIPAKKQVMILDACNSGKAVEALAAIGARELNSSQIRALDRMKDRTGMFILTGAAADKVSFEASQYGQGLLTYSLLQGMSGLALTSDKRVDVMTLFQYARDKVPELAKSIRQVQTPVLAFPADGGSFDIGIVDDGVKIPLAQVKPVFIRNNFQDEATYDDVLGLTKALAEYFQQITARGAQAALIYVDVNEYENAYSIKGRYTLDGDDVQVDGRLFQGKTSKGQFSVTGKKTALPELVESIVNKVSEMLKK